MHVQNVCASWLLLVICVLFKCNFMALTQKMWHHDTVCLCFQYFIVVGLVCLNTLIFSWLKYSSADGWTIQSSSFLSVTWVMFGWCTWEFVITSTDTRAHHKTKTDPHVEIHVLLYLYCSRFGGLRLILLAFSRQTFKLSIRSMIIDFKLSSTKVLSEHVCFISSSLILS